MTTADVSEVLGVEARQVRALAEREAITRVARGVFDRRSVERYLAERGPGRARVWSAHTAWAAIAMLSGEAATGFGVDGTRASRLRAALRQTVDPAALTVRLRDRARVSVWAGHRSIVDRVRAEVVVASRGWLGLVEDDGVVDGYAALATIEDLVDRFRLVRDSAGAITLRETAVDVDRVAHLAGRSTLAAVDAATSVDPRERGAGLHVLARVLKEYRERSSS